MYSFKSIFLLFIDYFVVDGASILPVLSLNLQPGDCVLDMCAAPGGKSLIAFQTLFPKLLVANDIQMSRVNRINDFINDLLPDIGDWDKQFFVTQSDARYIEDKDVYNKVFLILYLKKYIFIVFILIYINLCSSQILVDVPCTTDRHVLHEEDNNIFKGTRTKERLTLPELQRDILA